MSSSNAYFFDPNDPLKSRLSRDRWPLAWENLVYTAVTRGKRLVVIVGQRKALAIAVRSRWSAAQVDKTPRMVGGDLFCFALTKFRHR